MHTILSNSGGMAREGDDLVVISPGPISQQNIVEFVTNPSAGGIAVFIGNEIMLLMYMGTCCINM